VPEGGEGEGRGHSPLPPIQIHRSNIKIPISIPGKLIQLKFAENCLQMEFQRAAELI
jgi:hypothetical protein